MSEMFCMWLGENTGRKKSPKIRYLRTIAQICWAISSQIRHVDNWKKNLLNSNISSKCPHNMVNFGPLVVFFCHGMSVIISAANVVRPSQVYHAEHSPLSATRRTWWRRGVGNGVGRINEVTLHRGPVSIGMDDCLRADKPPRYLTSHPCQLSLLPSAGRDEYWPKCSDALWFGVKAGMGHSVCGCKCEWQVKLRSLVNTCHTWAPDGDVFTTYKALYKCPPYFTLRLLRQLRLGVNTGLSKCS